MLRTDLTSSGLLGMKIALRNKHGDICIFSKKTNQVIIYTSAYRITGSGEASSMIFVCFRLSNLLINLVCLWLRTGSRSHLWPNIDLSLLMDVFMNVLFDPLGERVCNFYRWFSRCNRHRIHPRGNLLTRSFFLCFSYVAA